MALIVAPLACARNLVASPIIALDERPDMAYNVGTVLLSPFDCCPHQWSLVLPSSQNQHAGSAPTSATAYDIRYHVLSHTFSELPEN